MSEAMTMQTRALLTTTLCLSFGLAGCGLEPIEDGGDEEGQAGLPAEVQAAFDQSCATAVGCHASGSSLVVLEAPESMQILESQSTAGGAFVSLGSIEDSYIAQKILGGPDISGGQMPPSPQSDDDDVNAAIIIGWIAGVPIEGEGTGGDGDGDPTGDGDGDPTGDGDGDPGQTCYVSEVPDMPSFEADVWPVLEARCATEFCHAATSPLMPDAIGAYDNLVGIASSGSDLNYVEAGSADGSYLWHKLAGTQASAAVGGAGGTMPASGDPLCAIEFQAIYAWITTGAML